MPTIRPSADFEESRRELYFLIGQGLEDVRNGDGIPFEKAVESIRKNLKIASGSKNCKKVDENLS